MKNTDLWVIVLLLVAGGIAVYYYQQTREEEPASSDAPARTESQPLNGDSEAPPIRYPIPDTSPPEAEVEPESGAEVPAEAEGEAGEKPDQQPVASPEPLPSLDDSDKQLGQELAAHFEGHALREVLYLDNIIRRFVVTIDNLPRTKLPRDKYLPAPRAKGSFIVDHENDDIFLSSDNFVRYIPFVSLIEAVESDKLVALYVRFYPLFQQAYADVGSPSAYFNDRLMDVIDDLLATPEIRGPIRLVRPHVLYRYVDPELEALSAGQKLLIRVGQENAAAIKGKLRELRRSLLAVSGVSGGAAAGRPADPGMN
jgi:hypothetical protein